MMKEDINKLYNKLCKDFTVKPFDEVMDEIREIIKKYYSCFPLIFRMGLLIVNHYDIVDEKKRELLISEALEIFIRIQETCNDIDICRQAKSMEATCYILLNQPIQVIDLLQNSNFPMINESILLAQGQMMNGQMDEARETFQLGAYQNLISLVQNLVGILQNADKLQMKEIERRILAISDIFELDTLSPAIMLSSYLTQAQINLIHGDNEGAIKSLRKYVDLATRDIYPIIIHGYCCCY